MVKFSDPNLEFVHAVDPAVIGAAIAIRIPAPPDQLANLGHQRDIELDAVKRV